MSNINFAIITFVDEDDVLDIVASNWIKPDGNSCYCPNVRTDAMKDKLLRRMAEPEDTWSQHQIKILKRYETYEEARFYLKKAEKSSYIESDDDEMKKRKRKIKQVYLSNDSDSTDDYPTPKEIKAREMLKKKKRFNKYLNEFSPDVQYRTSSKVAKCEPCCHQDVSCPSGCVSEQFGTQQSHLIQMVNDLSNQIVKLNRKVNVLLVRSEEPFHSQVEDSFAIPDFLANLPVQDDATFCHLNELLKIAQNKQATIKYLVGIGGRNVRSLATNMLRRILLDDVAQLYSLTGKQMKNSTKKPFIITETCKIIFQICKKVYYDVTEDKLKEITSDWLNQAKVRITRRAEREKKPQSVSNYQSLSD